LVGNCEELSLFTGITHSSESFGDNDKESSSPFMNIVVFVMENEQKFRAADILQLEFMELSHSLTTQLLK
jgi:hypothetical protein